MSLSGFEPLQQNFRYSGVLVRKPRLDMRQIRINRSAARPVGEFGAARRGCQRHPLGMDQIGRCTPRPEGVNAPLRKACLVNARFREAPTLQQVSRIAYWQQAAARNLNHVPRECAAPKHRKNTVHHPQEEALP
jgi:hypothetical protein